VQSSRSSPWAHLRGLRGASHYHQPAGRHPHGSIIQRGQERIELVTAGRGWIWHRERWCQVDAGSLAWHCVGDQTIARSDFDDPYRCLAVHIAVDPDAARPAPRLSRWDDLDEVRAFTRRVLRDVVDERFPDAVIAAYAYGVLLYRAHTDHHRRRHGGLPPPLTAAIELIEAGFAAELPSERIAEAAGWSVPHLHAAFKRHLEVTPHQYLIRRRLRAAREMLTTSGHPIAVVAQDCGFGDPAHFSRAFRQAVGMTPSAYRQRNAEPGRD